MSWKFGGIYLAKDHSRDWEGLRDRLGFRCPFKGPELPWRETIKSSFFDTGFGSVNNCTLVQNNLIPYDASYESEALYPLDEKLQDLSREEDVLCFFLDEMTSSLGFSVFSRGQRVRVYSAFSGRRAYDYGQPQKAEQAAAAAGEIEYERLFAMIRSFTGLSFEELLDFDIPMRVCVR